MVKKIGLLILVVPVSEDGTYGASRYSQSGWDGCVPGDLLEIALTALARVFWGVRR